MREPDKRYADDDQNQVHRFDALLHVHLRFNAAPCRAVADTRHDVAHQPRNDDAKQESGSAEQNYIQDAHTPASLLFQRQSIDALNDNVGISVSAEPLVVAVVHGMEAASVVVGNLPLGDVSLPEIEHPVEQDLL